MTLASFRFLGLMVLLLSLAWPAGRVFAQAQDVADEPAGEAAAPEQGNLVGWLELSDVLRDGPIPFAWQTIDDVGPSLDDVTSQIRTVGEGQQYLGMVIYLDQPLLTMPQVTAIADEIKAARKNGKTILAFSEAYDMRSYLIASACDEILLQHKGGVEVYGLAVEEMYLAGLLEKIGVKADFVQVGKFKGADETLTRTGPSEFWSKNFGDLLDDMYDQMLTRIAEGRKMDRQEVEKLVSDAWSLTDTQLIRRRVVDRLTDRDLIDVTEIEFGDEFVWDDAMGLSGGAAMPTNPIMMFQMLFQPTAERKPTRPTLAVIHASGPIHMGESSIGDGLFSSDSIGAKTMTRILGDVRDEDQVQGVVIRIDSPGGSALASEMIWQSVREIAEQKPVYVSIGPMAASGGYYIACAGDEVYIADQSIVGSIGVVGGKLTMGGLYEWAGISIHRRTRGGNADMFNSVEPFTEGQRALIRKSMENVYDQFTDRISRGRGNRLPDVSKVAEGRLFTGRQAVENGMADKVGGLRVAVNDLAKQLNLEAGTYDTVHFPRPMSLQHFLTGMLGASAPSVASPTTPMSPDSAAALNTARKLLGPAAWESVSRSLDGMLMLRDEHVLLMMPQAIVVK